MRVWVAHQALGDADTLDEQDVRVQAGAVSAALVELGHTVETVEVGLDLSAFRRRLFPQPPDLVFNLIEALDGRGIHIAAPLAVLESLNVPYTGARYEAVFCTSNKLLGKQRLLQAGLPTTAYRFLGANGRVRTVGETSGPAIVKSVWEHASIGIDDRSLVEFSEVDRLLEARGRAWFAEAFIDGREFNVALLGGPEGVRVLPPAEIRFVDFPAGKPRLVGYASKWEESSFEYQHTVRTIEPPNAADRALYDSLCDLARSAYQQFDLVGAARVDFRVDTEGRPWILEINANPCLSPDAGFFASAQAAGLSYRDVVDQLVRGAGPLLVRAGGTPADEPRPDLRDQAPLRSTLRPADREAIRGVVTSTGFFSEEEAGIAVEVFDEALVRGEGSGYSFLLADDERGRLRGFIAYGPIPGTEASADVYWIAVDPAAQGQGLGRRLLEAAETALVARGLRRIYIDTSARPLYLSTHQFYRALGYSLAAELPDFFAPGDGKVIFAKVI